MSNYIPVLTIPEAKNRLLVEVRPEALLPWGKVMLPV